MACAVATCPPPAAMVAKRISGLCSPALIEPHTKPLRPTVPPDRALPALQGENRHAMLRRHAAETPREHRRAVVKGILSSRGQWMRRRPPFPPPRLGATGRAAIP